MSKALVSIHRAVPLALAVMCAHAASPQNIQLSGFGAHIEGVSVDPWGNLYATHFRNSADNSTSGNDQGRDVIGRLPAGAASGGEAWYSILPPELDAQYNGMKWDSTGEYVYVADVGQGKVMKLGWIELHTGWDVHCSDPSWRALGMPNDLALSQSGLMFLSGQDWGSSTGALWLCRTNGDAVQLEGNMGRTNGVALSPDGATLYLTEARGSPVYNASQMDGQRIWKYSVAPDGSVSQKTLFFNFATDTNQPEANTDSDGMRTDVAGNLYVTRNGLGKVTVITPGGGLLREIQLSRTNYPTNVAFSLLGDMLYVVGRCGNASWSQGDGCVEVVPVPAVTPMPTPAPTPAPTSAPGTICCWIGCKSCSTSTGNFCDQNKDNCEETCGGNWCAFEGAPPPPPALAASHVPNVLSASSSSFRAGLRAHSSSQKIVPEHE